MILDEVLKKHRGSKPRQRMRGLLLREVFTYFRTLL